MRLKKSSPLTGSGSTRYTSSESQVFITAGTKIDSNLRTKYAGKPILAKPEGYTYFHQRTFCREGMVECGTYSEEVDPGFACARKGAVVYGSIGVGYRFAVKPGEQYVVALGFYNPTGPVGTDRQKVVVDGLVVDTVDVTTDGVSSNKPFVNKYVVWDSNRDGFLDVVCHQASDPVVDRPGWINIIWIFRGADAEHICTEQLLQGSYDVPPLYYVDCGRDEDVPGHTTFTSLPQEALRKMLPMLRVRPSHADWPHPADPLHVTISGELLDRIHAYVDRWGNSGRDQVPLGVDVYHGVAFEAVALHASVFSTLTRLTCCDYHLNAVLESMLSGQDHKSECPGALWGWYQKIEKNVGFLWAQVQVFAAFLECYEITGDLRALDAAKLVAHYWKSYLANGNLLVSYWSLDDNQWLADPQTEVPYGRFGEGIIESLIWLHLRTEDSQYLDMAKEIADLNRKSGGAAWMINPDTAEYNADLDCAHVHANLTTLHGFPWLFSVTGDRSYLDDAIKACDNVWEKLTAGCNMVQERFQWPPTPTITTAAEQPHDEVCQTRDLMYLSYQIADRTLEGRFFDRAEMLYYNGIRYEQAHDGSFWSYNTLPGPRRIGMDTWWCCGRWGAKALCEVAGHLYAVAPDRIYVNGFMPSTATLELQNGTVKIAAEADIPSSGKVRLTVLPKASASFGVSVRVPGWAVFKEIAVNGETLSVAPSNGYVTIIRTWQQGDKIDVHFELPLRISVDSYPDGLPEAKIEIDGKPGTGRVVSIYQGPVIIAQFRLAASCDLTWAYTGDHPDLFDTFSTAADYVEADDWQLTANVLPEMTKITNTAAGVRLETRIVPREGWVLNRMVLVRPGVPVKVEYRSELVGPSVEALQTIKAAHLCGTRMRTRASIDTWVDYKNAVVRIGGTEPGRADADSFAEIVPPGGELQALEAILDNGYVQFKVGVNEGVLTTREGADNCGIYVVPKAAGNKLRASCRLEITGQNQWSQPMIKPRAVRAKR
jgi:hypothetical protein